MTTRETQTPRDPVEKLSDFEAALLVLLRDVGGMGLTPYEIELKIEEGTAGLLGRSASAVYLRLPKLAERGVLEAVSAEGKRGRNATRYMLTLKGQEAIDVWLRMTPVRLPALDASDVFVRIRAARVDEPSVIWYQLRGLLLEIEGERDWLDALEREERRAATWSSARALELKLRHYLLDAYKSWYDEVARQWQLPDAFGDPWSDADKEKMRRRV